MKHSNHRLSDLIVNAFNQASAAQQCGDIELAYKRLEMAHILGQYSTYYHTKAHISMLRLAIKQRDVKEGLGQLMRIIGAVSKTWLGWLPKGNTGRANVSAFKPMPYSKEIQAILARIENGQGR